MRTRIALISLSLLFCLSIRAQTATNTRSFTAGEIAEMKAMGIDPSTAEIVPSITNKEGYVIPAEDVAYFRKQGYTDKEIATSYRPPQQQKTTLSPTPTELKNAYIWMDNFIGMTNANIMADVISMKAETLKFRLYGKNYDYGGHYTVMLNIPRKHTNPYFGLGSPETAKVLILESVGGDTFPLQNATIWEKGNGFIDATTIDKEWIYSGTYTIQN